MILVTGGAGFFGEVLVKALLERGNSVRCFDLNAPHFQHDNLEVRIGDIRDGQAVKAALSGVETVFHNVAQVPVAKDRALFWSVNYIGMETLLKAASDTGVSHLVYTSSSAVFGIPKSNPVNKQSRPQPMEDYGRAKLEAEKLCQRYANDRFTCAVVRPRTVLGHGRLGIFQILFEWIYQDKNVPVLGNGDNTYQFVHAEDLAMACILAGEKRLNQTYNIGANEFSTMRDTLENLIDRVSSKSKVCAVPRRAAELAMNVTSSLGLSPLGPYHSLMYGRSMFFDTDEAFEDLGFRAQYSNDDMFYSTYLWYQENRAQILSGQIAGSKHQSAISQGVLRFLPYIMR